MGTRRLGLFVLLIALLGGAGWGLANLDLGRLFQSLSGPVEARKETPTDDKANTASLADYGGQAISDVTEALGRGPDPKGNGEKPTFDVARVNPDGVSVFAGQAKPNQDVSVYVGQRYLGTAKSDADGNWSLASETPIPNPDGELEAKLGRPAPVEVAVNDPVGARTGMPQETVADVNARLFSSLEGLVAEARAKKEAEARAEKAAANPDNRVFETAPRQPAAGSQSDGTPEVAASSVDPNNPSANTASSDEGEATNAPTSVTQRRPDSAIADEAATREQQATSQLPTPDAQVRSRTIPIPIQFVYREATFTEQGQKAVRLLLEYLKITGKTRVTLSGHADERGSADLNMDLSRQRLQAVRDELRAGGYDGALILVPKGESEPFAGVDRDALPEQDLFQLDRRVELRLEG